MSVVVWVHGDCLSPLAPNIVAYPGAPTIFVFDDRVIVDYELSLGRLQFIYECLLELPVTIRRGDVADEVVAFATAQSADRIVTVASVAPRFASIVRQIEAHVPIEVLEPEPLVSLHSGADLRRFSRYWRRVEARLTRPDPNPTLFD